MDILKLAGSYVLSRLAEGSTWATLIAAFAAQMHLTVSPDLNSWLVQGGLWLATGAGVLLKEGSK